MRILRGLGILLIFACVVGFLTVADDLRHVGELVGVSAIGVVGVALAAGAHLAVRRRG